MGIDGLLQLLKPITKKQHLSSFKNKRIGIDASVWLYKGCYQSAKLLNIAEIQVNNQLNYSLSPCSYLLIMISLLQHYQIQPIFVFDGRSLSMKSNTIANRESTKNKNQQRLSELSNKQSTMQEAEILKLIGNSIKIDDNIINGALAILQDKGIQYIFAPYESDSQLAKLSSIKYIDAVITEDSDLLVYGCPTIYKLNDDGECQYIDLHDPQLQSSMKYLDCFLSMPWQQRIYSCVLAGCDYVNSIKGIGIKRAITAIHNNKTIQQTLQLWKHDKVLSARIPQEYFQKVKNAITIFKYATTFNPLSKQLESFTPISESEPWLQQIVGCKYPEYIDLQIYHGRYHSKTLQKREILINQRTMDIETNVLRLSEIQGLFKQNKREIEELSCCSSKIKEENMLDALFDVQGKITLEINNGNMTDLVDTSLQYILRYNDLL